MGGRGNLFCEQFCLSNFLLHFIPICIPLDNFFATIYHVDTQTLIYTNHNLSSSAMLYELGGMLVILRQNGDIARHQRSRAKSLFAT